MDSIIKYIKRVPTWKNAIGIGATALSIYGMITSGITSIVLLGLGFALLRTEGVEIDLASKKYRELISILGINFGKWKVLPELDYISVFATTESTRVWASAASAVVKDRVILLNIFYDGNKKIEVYRSYDLKDAFTVASHYADALIIDLLDATTPNDFKWVDKNVLRDTGEVKYIS